MKKEKLSKHDRQVIVQFDFDKAISTNSERLNDGSTIPSEIVTVRPGSGTGIGQFSDTDVAALTKAFEPLTGSSRVYLQGHGDWKSQCLSKYDAEAVALLLATTNMPAVNVVSVLGCSLGRDAGIVTSRYAPGEARLLADSMASFGSNLLVELGRHGIWVSVLARLFDVAITVHGRKKVFLDDDDKNGETAVSKAEASKVIFYWNNGSPMRAWEY